MVSKPQTSAAVAETKKKERAEDGAKAIAEYEAAAEATREKTARLKALRLAKEAAEGKTAAAKPSGSRTSGAKTSGTKTPAQKSSKSKAKSVSLSAWLDTERGSGRRS